ncbi:hypothetical protein AB0K60_11545 [Thermopolyspora sp. NPDC052614]|uniref:hypothetical protein n=1 Tax=Thermopolyspora sp. NPDC052614 TaxID=3155682 RepID=UPI003421E9AF
MRRKSHWCDVYSGRPAPVASDVVLLTSIFQEAGAKRSSGIVAVRDGDYAVLATSGSH